ncbi:hypothetical protein [Verrucomicrobium spinosum]|uniref:hypothetical protein n=1 Tax=Verrucomicrobium spinosum TaxID=2736 RepID=UPI0009467BEA|nr:hypothetical protein [Verrucomicrobium spinosum]
MATILNKQTKENFVVSETPNAQGWKLAETSATVQLSRTQAKIMVGAEMVTVRYSNEQLSPESMKKGGFRLVVRTIVVAMTVRAVSAAAPARKIASASCPSLRKRARSSSMRCATPERKCRTPPRKNGPPTPRRSSNAWNGRTKADVDHRPALF